MANRVLAGYIAPNDSGKYDLMIDHDGPASYANTGTFGTSGEQINAADFGIGGFELIGVDSVTSDGVSVCEVVLGATVAGGVIGAPPPAPPGPVFTTAVIHWFTSVTRVTEFANATNLAGKTVRLRILGV